MASEFLRWLLLGATMGALFGLVLILREPDWRRRIFWSFRFWVVCVAALALLGLAGPWLELA